jgi:hypothetical protein
MGESNEICFYTVKNSLDDYETIKYYINKIFIIIDDACRIVNINNIRFRTNSSQDTFKYKIFEILKYIESNINPANSEKKPILTILILKSYDTNCIQYRYNKNTEHHNTFIKLAEQIIDYYNKNPSVNESTKKYITQLFGKNFTTSLVITDNLYTYNDNTLTVYNTTSRYYKEGMFRIKHLYTNDLFYNYICFIIDVLKKITSSQEINHMMSNLFLDMPACNTDVYNGIWNNLSVCYVLKRMNAANKAYNDSLKQIQENNNAFNDNSTRREIVESQLIAYNFVPTHLPSQGQDPNLTTDEKIIKIEFLEDDFHDNNKLISFLEKYTPEEEIMEYVNNIIGEKSGRTGTMRLSRLVRPRTWTFRRTLAPRMGLRGGGRRAKARTRRLKPRTRRRKR